MKNNEGLYKLETFKVSLKVSEEVNTGTHITEVNTAANLLLEIFKSLDAGQEHGVVLFLNAQNQITGYKVLFSGGQNHATVDPVIIFRSALLFGATSIMMAHNHPSCTVEPSDNDIRLTRRLVDAGKIIDIKLMDHIIITDTKNLYFSFSEKGML